MSAIVNEIADGSLIRKAGLENLRIATDKIIVAGHSFGGITSIKTM